jgi:hypothetical protein
MRLLLLGRKRRLEALVCVLALGLNGALQRILGDDEGLVAVDARIDAFGAVVKARRGGDDAGLVAVVKARRGGDDARGLNDGSMEAVAWLVGVVVV